jgi:hypothetical protein
LVLAGDKRAIDLYGTSGSVVLVVHIVLRY